MKYFRIHHWVLFVFVVIPLALTASGIIVVEVGRSAAVARQTVVSVPPLVRPLAVVELPNIGYARERVMPPVRLLAVGDLMFSRSVAAKLKEQGDNYYPFDELGDTLASGDITFGNLETAIMAGRVIKSGEMVFRSDPEVAGALADAGFDIVSLANNHSMNFGVEGMEDTLRYLSDANVATVGGGINAETAREPKVIERNGLRLAFLAYVDGRFTPTSYEAKENLPGVAMARVEDVREDVARAKGIADLVIVSFHWGQEYQPKFDAIQKRLAHTAIEAGATLIIGHHPHVVQEVERYKDGLIIYSLGNFIFDQMWSQDTRRGLIAEIKLGADGWREARFKPIEILDYAQPRAASAAAARAVKSRLGFSVETSTDGWWTLEP